MWYILGAFVFIGLSSYCSFVLAGRVDDQIERDWINREEPQGPPCVSVLWTEYLDHSSEEWVYLSNSTPHPQPLTKINPSP